MLIIVSYKIITIIINIPGNPYFNPDYIDYINVEVSACDQVCERVLA